MKADKAKELTQNYLIGIVNHDTEALMRVLQKNCRITLYKANSLSIDEQRQGQPGMTEEEYLPEELIAQIKRQEKYAAGFTQSYPTIEDFHLDIGGTAFGRVKHMELDLFGATKKDLNTYVHLISLNFDSSQQYIRRVDHKLYQLD